ncbi:hypothetical protein V6B11_007910 [Vibrio anguillarum]|nr:hypothetical protein [Vibrio anguillarum]MBT2911832.1 hypothetical protein [Vibrio anguillarum]MBT2944073.1 hypothetical protein [Vibrio anguillarum]MBT2951558.1 hypothetical protein [Vibrio anguillarum]
MWRHVEKHWQILTAPIESREPTTQRGRLGAALALRALLISAMLRLANA